MRSDESGEVCGPFLRRDVEDAFSQLLSQRPPDKSPMIIKEVPMKAMEQVQGARRRSELKAEMQKEEEGIKEAVELEKQEEEEKQEWALVDLDEEDDPELWAGV